MKFLFICGISFIVTAAWSEAVLSVVLNWPMALSSPNCSPSHLSLLAPFLNRLKNSELTMPQFESYTLWKIPPSD